MAPDDEREIVLAGGNMASVTRVGDEVRRPAGAWTANVHALLSDLADAGIPGVPRALGLTADGRERLSFVPGEVAHYPLPDWLWQEEILVSTATLLRRIHDASVERSQTTSGWRSPIHEPAEVVCHNDFAPYNLVFAEHALVGVIDFDLASPGPRLWDLSYLAYRLVPFVEDADAPRAVRAVEGQRLHLLLSAYGIEVPVEAVLSMMAERLDALAEHSRAESRARPELGEHAAMYERDAARLRARITPSPASNCG